MQPSSVMSSAGLRQIEELLIESGADISVLQNNQGKVSKSRAQSQSNPNNRTQDCLSGASRLQDTTNITSVSAISRRSNTSVRGASIAGKGNSESQYIGHGFEGPSRESPGPIYQPISTLNTSGQSFTKALRMPASHDKSVSPGPDVVLPPTIGKQHLSTNVNQPSIVFSKATRWKPRSRSSTPIAYQTLESTNDGKGYSFGNSKTVAANKLFISRGHIADCQGLDSPGPKYFLEDPFKKDDKISNTEEPTKPPVFLALKSQYTNAPSFSFATKKRMEDDRNGVRDLPPRPNTTEPSVGPGQYDPSFSLAENSAPSISFTKQRIHSANYVRKTSPGPGNHEKALSFLDKHTPSVSWGNPHDSFNRMNEKVYLGKGMDQGRGKDSPGPALQHPDGYTPYDSNWQDGKYKGKGISLSFKEKSVQKRLHTGPDKARFISKDLASENLGAFSPGPKYNPGPNPGWSRAPAVTFGVSDRYFGDGFSPEHKAKFGTAEKPYTSPGQARFVSLMHSKVALSGTASPGPKGNPTIEGTSKYKRSPAIGIAPPTRVNDGTKEAESQPPCTKYTPSYRQIDMENHVHSFGKAKRIADVEATGVPGPGQYQPSYVQVEARVPDVSIGIL